MKNCIYFFLIVAAFPSAHAGVFGSGNTADSSLQFNFIRATAINLIRSVSPHDVLVVSSNPSLASLYEGCRETIFSGLLQAKFDLLESIPDGDGYHALARRRAGGVIEISRSEVKKMMAANTLTAPFLTALILHEVAHDCIVNGKPLDDSADPILNELGMQIVEASNSNTLAPFLDLDFVARVARGQKMSFLELSAQSRQIILDRYLNYLGDWAYLEMKDQLAERPAPASDFNISMNLSLVPSWGNLVSRNQIPGTLEYLVKKIMRTTYEQKEFAYDPGNGLKQALPTALDCRPTQAEGVSTARCKLSVFWTPTRDLRYSGGSQKLQFSVNIFGQLTVDDIKFHH